MTRRGHTATPPGAPNPAFRAAILFSGLLHLSMVTIFSIVIYFPGRNVEYYDFSIVEMPDAPPSALGPGTLTLGGGPDARLPEIELPQLEFAQLDRLRIRQESLGDNELYSRLFPEEEPRDSWQRLTRSLREARLSLSRSFGGREDAGEQARPAGAAQPIHRPAQGFEAYLEWQNGPPDRLLLFAPPIEALWELNPDTLRRPIEIIMEVNPQGRVVNVWSPSIEPEGIIDSVQLAVLKYRFEPLLGNGNEAAGEAPSGGGSLRIPRASGGNATAVLHIRAERPAP